MGGLVIESGLFVELNPVTLQPVERIQADGIDFFQAQPKMMRFFVGSDQVNM